MFVEHLSWDVPRDVRPTAIALLRQLAQHMDASGGLIKALLGHDVAKPERLVCLSFWEGWEELSRFLAHPNSDILEQTSTGSSISFPRPHHYEVIWKWSSPENTRPGSRWVLHDFAAAESEIEVLFDNLRLSVPRLVGHAGFLKAGLWVDKNNSGHGALATQWSAEAQSDDSVIDATLLFGSAKVQAHDLSRSTYELTVLDPKTVQIQ